jgi:transglutaminase-like putative cysteine protease
MALLTREMLQPEEQSPTEAHYFIPDGSAGIAATLDMMVALTKKFRKNITVRTIAEQIVAPLQQKNYYAEAQAVQDWVRNNIRYTQDVYDVETLKDPIALFHDRLGDCDDMSLMAGTLLQSIGHPVRYVAVGSQVPGEYDHVYVETKIGQRWVGLECTEPVELGWVPSPQVSRMVRNV